MNLEKIGLITDFTKIDFDAQKDTLETINER